MAHKKNRTKKTLGLLLRTKQDINDVYRNSDPRSQGILERLDAGEVVIGDGGFVFALEKRGYVKAGPWTPEAAAEFPEAGWLLQQLHGCLFKHSSAMLNE